MSADPRTTKHVRCDCVPDIGPSHCHLCSRHAGREMAWEDAHPRLAEAPIQYPRQEER